MCSFRGSPSRASQCGVPTAPRVQLGVSSSGFLSVALLPLLSSPPSLPPSIVPLLCHPWGAPSQSPALWRRGLLPPPASWLHCASFPSVLLAWLISPRSCPSSPSPCRPFCSGSALPPTVPSRPGAPSALASQAGHPRPLPCFMPVFRWLQSPPASPPCPRVISGGPRQSLACARVPVRSWARGGGRRGGMDMVIHLCHPPAPPSSLWTAAGGRVEGVVLLESQPPSSHGQWITERRGPGVLQAQHGAQR